jgi:peptidoglycan/LPS O-acetylase OafA/YrhL
MQSAIAQFVFMFFKRFIGHPNLHFIYDIIYPTCVLAATSAVAAFSYYFFESWFLRKKARLQLASQKLWPKKTNTFSRPSAIVTTAPVTPADPVTTVLIIKKTAETSSETP